MEKTLAYLREILSNHLSESETCHIIYEKISNKDYKDENAFIDDLDENEMMYLNNVLPDEIQYAQNEQDDQRTYELTNIYDRLI
ncbi:sporulation protein [Bacillus sp. Marseille-P3661]|uniref:sporulation protein n=1 Tax=Bacillus sp. Marseille-P3661 TaxID=1936234 RepID=UPI000C85EAEC|nr:sporulation protein [Bacillus sp. Marseille-P3661]